VGICSALHIARFFGIVESGGGDGDGDGDVDGDGDGDVDSDTDTDADADDCDCAVAPGFGHDGSVALPAFALLALVAIASARRLR